jgi:hypothetical protein
VISAARPYNPFYNLFSAAGQRNGFDALHVRFASLGRRRDLVNQTPPPKYIVEKKYTAMKPTVAKMAYKRAVTRCRADDLREIRHKRYKMPP